MKRKKVLITLGVLIVISALIGLSYAIWRLTLSQTGNNRIATSHRLFKSRINQRRKLDQFTKCLSCV